MIGYLDFTTPSDYNYGQLHILFFSSRTNILQGESLMGGGGT